VAPLYDGHHDRRPQPLAWAYWDQLAKILLMTIVLGMLSQDRTRLNTSSS